MQEATLVSVYLKTWYAITPVLQVKRIGTYDTVILMAYSIRPATVAIDACGASILMPMEFVPRVPFSHLRAVSLTLTLTCLRARCRNARLTAR